MTDWLTIEIIDSICNYMNSQQEDSVLSIAQQHIMDSADEAQLLSFTKTHADFLINKSHHYELDWPLPLEDRNHIREQLMQLASYNGVSKPVTNRLVENN